MSEMIPTLTLKDFATDQEIRWCPGCGDYAILKTMQKLMPGLEQTKENQVFVSGIGCSSRFPYYMNTYGFHTIHGRAPALATGIKLANPELNVWVITGDGDGFSIGGNHMMHVLRRNVDVQLLLFNNEIYGLTKGQYSPTSAVGTRSPSSPQGSVDLPLAPCELALGAGATFVARSIDTEAKHLSGVVKLADEHRGASFVEILQNCPIYSDGIFENVKNKKLAADFKVEVEHGKPLVFGKERNKGIQLDSQALKLKVVELSETVSEAKLLVHDENNKVLAQMLSTMSGPDFPVAVGLIYRQDKASYVDDSQKQAAEVRKNGISLQELLNSGYTWIVE
ncbi:MAG: 2-oxoacid:ferredoxin oxidoreductase subunit beta [Gammaproteobacteria bacterium]|jgi:2-oxoglutarate ferredoxin oxidoreductase subunit beta|nr:2-oxoacid:ferredoxin oxidoreductase subunit beta [Gammaproteobacteria bacterium]HJO12064.1 2-oxoacid:ferredoxin oxidoreductase subunit beta [Gammaproteobacteria bacterium]|tara:strand:- start:45 stop:1055 length:1011 start_codon:yes stop_codon:yes gene_type:complete